MGLCVCIGACACAAVLTLMVANSDCSRRNECSNGKIIHSDVDTDNDTTHKDTNM
jgi:hypothetical protein